MRTSTLYFLVPILILFQPARAQLVLNEVMAVNTSGAYNPVIEEPGDWIEIYNGTGYLVDMAGYFLSDDPDEPTKWSFPPKTYISPGAYHLVWADGTNSTLYGSHTNFKLDVSGETILLHNRSGVLYDSLSFPAMHENISYGFSMDGSGLYFKEPTPGAANDNGTGFLYSGGVAFDPPPAIHSGPVEVHMTSDTPGGNIRYTLDGSPPGPDDPIYTNPIVVSENSVIRAQLWVDGFEPGAISTGSYIFSEGFTLPVVSIATDPYNLFDDEYGIYVEGTNGRTGYCMDVPVNWNMDWERPLSFEYFDLQGERRVQHDGGTKIHGGCSRGAPMKSLAIFARSKYGSSRINYPFFAQKEANSFKGLILRNSGNDNQYTYIRDGVIQAVVDPLMDIDGQAYEPVQLFLNGEYWGIHNLREKVNEHWVTSNYGIPDENVDFIKNQSEVFAGTLDEYERLTTYLNDNSLESDDNFKYVEERIDLNSYTDYLFTHLFFANRDWPGNNQKYWRDRVNGSKWRYIMFDLDFTMGIYNFDPAIDMLSFATAPDLEDWPNPAWSTLLIRRLLENETYRKQFIQKYQVHLNTTFLPERVNSVIDSFYYRLYDIFPAHVERWGRPWGGIDEWHFFVDQLRLFANERPGYVRENMRNFFALGREINLEIKPLEKSGQINVNDVSLPLSGMKGSYTAGLDLDLEFRTTPGYIFNGWQVITMNVLDSIILPRNSTWKYNDTGIYPGDSWNTKIYDDSHWQEGFGELGFGDGGESTILDFGVDDQNKHISYYFRHEFEIQNPESFSELALDMLHDDGAVVYLNGMEVFRYNMPSGDVYPETVALTGVGGDDENRYFRHFIQQGSLVSGHNLIAVEIHQNQGASSDLGFDLGLLGMIQNGVDTLYYEDSQMTLKLSAETSIKAISSPVELNPRIQICINEFMASNQGTYTDEYGENEDWVELYNSGENGVDLSGFYFTDDPMEPTKWQIPSVDPEITTVNSKDHILFFADNDTTQGPLHLNFKLSSAGEFIGLSAKIGDSFLWLDSIHFGPQIANESYGRFPDGSVDWMALYPQTPLQSNLITHTLPVVETSLTLSVFPNPTSDWLNVSMNCTGTPGVNPLVLSLRDLTGRWVEERSLQIWQGQNSFRMDLMELPAGIYILTVESESGLISKKIIKTD
jgi:hypothetical protein